VLGGTGGVRQTLCIMMALGSLRAACARTDAAETDKWGCACLWVQMCGSEWGRAGGIVADLEFGIVAGFEATLA